ncbi:MAG: glutathione S-transferase family protein, partial [Pseudomonadota bacterium]
QSTFTRVVRIAAEEKGVPYELVPEPPHSEAVNAIHPLGRLPVMRHGDLELCESRAICGYIDETFDGPALIPGDAVGRARMDQWVSMTNTGLDPLLIRKYLFAYLFPSGPEDGPDREAIDGMLDDVNAHLGVIEKGVDGKTTIVGNSPTLADFNLLPMLAYLKGTPEGGARIAGSPALTAYFDHYAARPSFQATIPPPLPKD